MENSGSSGVGTGVGPDPYSHLIATPHPVDMEANNPNHPINLPHGVSPPFSSASPVHDGRKRSGNPHNNIPNRFELFLLGEGEKKITEATDTRTPNTSIFTVNKEDHTLANLLRAHLLKDPHVTFAGYKVPHPLFANFELRVQTDGEKSPRDALVDCARGIIADLGQLSREFTKEFELRKMVAGEGSSANPTEK